MASSSRILGIDPGSHHLGVGCLDKAGGLIKLVFAETIHAPKSDDLYLRLDAISRRLDQVIDALKPEVIALEDIFCAKNARSAFVLGIARGVVIAACLRRGIKIFEYSPTHVKATVTGYGRADKAQVKKMVQLVLGQTLDLGFDATDAIAIAICHANGSRIQGLTT